MGKMDNIKTKGSPIWPCRDDFSCLGFILFVGENTVQFRKLWDNEESKIFESSYIGSAPTVGELSVFYRTPTGWTCLPYRKSLVVVMITSTGKAQEIVYGANGTWQLVGNEKDYNLLNGNSYNGSPEIGRRFFAVDNDASYTLIFNGFLEKIDEHKASWGRGNEIYEAIIGVDVQGKIVDLRFLYANQESDFEFSGYDYNAADGTPSDQLTPVLGGTLASGICYYETYTMGNGTGTSTPNSKHPFHLDFNGGCSVSYYRTQTYDESSSIPYVYSDLYYTANPISDDVYYGNGTSGIGGGQYGTYVRMKRCGTGPDNPKMYGEQHPYFVSEDVYGVPEQTRTIIEATNGSSSAQDYLYEYGYYLAYLPGMDYNGQRLGVLLNDTLTTTSPDKSGKLNYLTYNSTSGRYEFGFDPPTLPQFDATTQYVISPERTRTGVHRSGMAKVKAFPKWNLTIWRFCRTYNPATDVPFTGANWCCIDCGSSSLGAHTGINEDAGSFWIAGYATKTPSGSNGEIPNSNGVYATYYTIATLKVGSRYPDGGRIYASRTQSNWYYWDTGTSSWLNPGTGTKLSHWYAVDLYGEISRISDNYDYTSVVLT